MFWFAVFTALLLAAAWYRMPLFSATVAFGAALLFYLVFGGSPTLFLLLALIYAGLAVPLNVPALRQEWFTRPLLPSLLSRLAGAWKGERHMQEPAPGWAARLAGGAPDLVNLLPPPAPNRSAEAQAWLSSALPGLLPVLHPEGDALTTPDLPETAFEQLRSGGWFRLAGPQSGADRGLPPAAMSQVLSQLAGLPRGVPAALAVACAGPAGAGRLIQRHGSEEQQAGWHRMLQEESALLALPQAWTSGEDPLLAEGSGRIARGLWHGREVLGLRLQFSFAHVPYARQCSVLLLRLPLSDPDRLLGPEPELGARWLLVPTALPGVDAGLQYRSLALGASFGPLHGRDVFIPLNHVLGGAEQLREPAHEPPILAAALRSIALPALVAGAGSRLVLASGPRLALEAGLSGVAVSAERQALLGRVLGRAYAAEALRRFGLLPEAGDDVTAALVERAALRQGLGMAEETFRLDGRRAAILGPRHPAALTREALREVLAGPAQEEREEERLWLLALLQAEPGLQQVLDALEDPSPAESLARVDAALWPQIGRWFSAAVRSLILALGGARLIAVPGAAVARRLYQQLLRYSSAFAALAPLLLIAGGRAFELERRQRLRLSRMLAALHQATAGLQRWEEDGRPAAELPLLRWTCTEAWCDFEREADALLSALRPRPLALLGRMLVLPLGRQARPADDGVEQSAGELAQQPSVPALGALQPLDPDLVALSEVLDEWQQCETLRQRVDLLKREEQELLPRIGAACARGLLTETEANRLYRLHKRMQDLLALDEQRWTGTAGAATG